MKKWLIPTISLTIVVFNISVNASDLKWVVTNTNNSQEVGLVDAETGEFSTLFAPTLNPSQTISSPAISPDGSTLAFIMDGALYKADIGSNNYQPISNIYGYKDHPVGNIEWAGDSQSLLFSNSGSGIHQIDLDPATNDETVLTSNYFDEILDIHFSSSEICFWNSLYRSPTESYTMDMDGSNIQSYDPLGTLQTKGAVYTYLGDYGIVTNERPDRKGLWIVDSNGNLVSSQSIADFYLRSHEIGSWSPDGSEFAFIGRQNISDLWGLWSIHPDGSGLTLLYEIPSEEDLRVWDSYLIPEPATLCLLVLGAMLAGRRRRI